MKKTISAILLSELLVMGMSSCHTASKIGRINTNESNPEKDHYELTVEIRGTLVAAEGAADTFPSEYTTIEVRFASKDLIHWSLMETESNKFKRAAEILSPQLI